MVEEFSEDERVSFTIIWIEMRWDCERLGTAWQAKNDKEIKEVGGLDESIAIQVSGAGGFARAGVRGVAAPRVVDGWSGGAGFEDDGFAEVGALGNVSEGVAGGVLEEQGAAKGQAIAAGVFDG